MFTKKANHLKTGEVGESLVCEYLVRKGYRILERNHRRTYGEIDIIARDARGTLVFVEVKTMRGVEGGLVPEDNVSESKMKKVRKTCEAYANHNPSLVKEKRGWRIDIIAVELGDDPKNHAIRWYENV